MAITDDILALKNGQEQTQQQSWVKDLIDKRYQPKTERLKRAPVGFDFKRDPFDPSSYYKQLGSYRDISRAATGVVRQEVANREAAERQRAYEQSQQAMIDAMNGINPNFTYGDGATPKNTKYKYKLGGVSSNTKNAAYHFGNKYGIKSIGGYRSHGSVPGSDHPKGRALDFMTRNKVLGTSLANDVIKNYRSWNVKYVIWNRYIWSPGKGWRKYNGPSPHTDHVHVSFNK